MTPFRLAFQFVVIRRIDWAGEELGDHIDMVIERLRQADGVRSIEAEGDLNTGHTNFTVRYTTSANEPEHHGRSLLGVAIRSCGAAHNGLLPFAEEAAVKPQGTQWSGLRTPSWNVRQVTFGLDPDDA